MVRTRLGDEKFNERFLGDLKRSFNKKMFDLKATPAQKGKREYDFE